MSPGPRVGQGRTTPPRRHVYISHTVLDVRAALGVVGGGLGVRPVDGDTVDKVPQEIGVPRLLGES